MLIPNSSETYFSLAWASEGAPDPLPLAYIAGLLLAGASGGGGGPGFAVAELGGPTNVIDVVVVATVAMQCVAVCVVHSLISLIPLFSW